MYCDEGQLSGRYIPFEKTPGHLKSGAAVRPRLLHMPAGEGKGEYILQGVTLPENVGEQLRWRRLRYEAGHACAC